MTTSQAAEHAELIPGRWYWVSEANGSWHPALHNPMSSGGWTNQDTWEDFDRAIIQWRLIPLPSDHDARHALAQPEPPQPEPTVWSAINAMAERIANLETAISAARAALAQPEPVGLPPRVSHVLRLAEIIREVDGNHDKGAAALAEAILNHPGSRWQSREAQPEPVGPTDEELVRVYQAAYQPAWERGEFHGCHVDGLRAVLQRWGNPSIYVVPCGDLAEPEAEPEPVAPTDNELLRCMIDAADSIPDGQTTGIIDWEEEALAAARAVLSRWGRPAITPIPVSERLPGAEDCDADGFCWWFSAADPTVGTLGVAACWVLRKHEPEDDDWRTHWLPAHALPFPRQPAPTATAS